MKSLEKFGVLVSAPFTSMRRSCENKEGLMHKYLISSLSLLLLTLSTLTTLSVRAEQQQVLEVQTLLLRITLHQNTESVGEACGTEGSAGCMYPLNDAGFYEMHSVMPKDWCDVNVTETLGHEMLHAMGRHHSAWYTPIYYPQDEVDKLRDGDCKFYPAGSSLINGR